MTSPAGEIRVSCISHHQVQPVWELLMCFGKEKTFFSLLGMRFFNRSIAGKAPWWMKNLHWKIQWRGRIKALFLSLLGSFCSDVFSCMQRNSTRKICSLNVEGNVLLVITDKSNHSDYSPGGGRSRISMVGNGVEGKILSCCCSQ